MVGMTKKDQSLIKRIEKDLNKMASFEVWSENLKHWSDVQDIVQNSGLTAREFYDKSRQEYLDIIERIKAKYKSQN